MCAVIQCVWSYIMCGHPICGVIRCVRSSDVCGHPICVVIQCVRSSIGCAPPMFAVIQCARSSYVSVYPMCAFIPCARSSHFCGHPMCVVHQYVNFVVALQIAVPVHIGGFHDVGPLVFAVLLVLLYFAPTQPVFLLLGRNVQ